MVTLVVRCTASFLCIYIYVYFEIAILCFSEVVFISVDRSRFQTLYTRYGTSHSVGVG